jgi:hypothetical protein
MLREDRAFAADLNPGSSTNFIGFPNPCCRRLDVKDRPTSGFSLCADATF